MFFIGCKHPFASRRIKTAHLNTRLICIRYFDASCSLHRQVIHLITLYAVSFIQADRPVPLRPHRWTKNGRHPNCSTRTEAKDATCTEAGNTEYWTCSVCKKLFGDGTGTTEITAADTVVAAKGHSLEKTEAKDATCTEAGNIEYWTCSECEKLFSDEEGTTEITAAETVVAAKGHSLEKTEAKDATCTEAGNIEYWTCIECKKRYKDSESTQEITAEAIVKFIAKR